MVVVKELKLVKQSVSRSVFTDFNLIMQPGYITAKTLHTLVKDPGLAASVSDDEMSLMYVGFITSSWPRFTPCTTGTSNSIRRVYQMFLALAAFPQDDHHVTTVKLSDISLTFLTLCGTATRV